MKFTVYLKDPDGFSNSIMEAAENSVANIEGLSEMERKELAEGRIEQIGDSIQKWVEYGEYIKIEFDTDQGTATVLPR